MAKQPQPVQPAGAYIATGSRVVAVVSRGQRPTPPASYVTTPSVVGDSQGDALGKLQEVGLQAQVFNDYSDRFARGRVMGQLPDAEASAPSGADAVLLVSSGPAASQTASVALPEIVGMQEADAVSKLQSTGLSPQVTYEYSPSVPAGIVMAQLPSRASLANQPAPRSNWLIWVITAAVLVALVAAGFLFFGNKVTVPDVTSKPQAEATAALKAAGLEVGSVESTVNAKVPEGTVVAQDPAGNESVRKGSKVNLVVVSGKPMVEVPDVLGQSESAASAALKAAGLGVAATSAPSDTVDKGDVISQTPPAGQQVPEGTTVGLVVSGGPEVKNVTVPDVTGQTQSDATDQLTTLGLSVVKVENPNADVPSGQVVSQSPPAGSSVAPGTSIAIIVSTGPPPVTQTINVPDVTGDTLSDAQGALSKLGLKSQTVAVSGTGKPANEVVAQTPGGGTAVAPDSTVVLFFSNGK